jgi:hypothetical protein
MGACLLKASLGVGWIGALRKSFRWTGEVVVWMSSREGTKTRRLSMVWLGWRQFTRYWRFVVLQLIGSQLENVESSGVVVVDMVKPTLEL